MMKTHEISTTVRKKKTSTAGIPIRKTEQLSGTYDYKETRELVQLTSDAAALIRDKGEKAFSDFRLSGSRWRQGDTYIFVLDPKGNMVVHADPEMEGKNQLSLEDINGRPIIRGIRDAATAIPGKPEGWYHYQWPVPGGLLPRWKSSYVQSVKAPSGEAYIVGSGMYNDRMERAFVMDAVARAVEEVEKKGTAAFKLFHDPTGPFMVKDAYIFVIDKNGMDVVNPAFPNLEGRNLMDTKDTQGKFLIREMFDVVKSQGSGWVDYMWPKPGESVSTQKSAFVSKANVGDTWMIVGCGVYLADAPTTATTTKMTAPELMRLVRDAAEVLEQKGEQAFPEFRKQGSKWFRDDTYFFIWTMNGIRIFNAADPASEGVNVSNLKDVHARPIGQMILEAATRPEGEGWVHYMYPEPGDIFPAWKSSFVKRVTFPSKEQFIIGCGIYNMQMDRTLIEDVVHRAADLIKAHGKKAFSQLHDRTGPFVFMDTYVFVQSPEGIELMNGGLPSLEGQNLMDLKDLKGRRVIQEEIEAAMSKGSAWIEMGWYKPGDNTPALKNTFVRKVVHKGETFIVGSGFYNHEETSGHMKRNGVQKIAWQALEDVKLSDTLSRQTVFGEKGTMARFRAKAGASVSRHVHANEEYEWVVSGALKFSFDDQEVQVSAGEVLVIPANVPHSIVVLKDSAFVSFFSPVRKDWLRGEDQYLRT